MSATATSPLAFIESMAGNGAATGKKAKKQKLGFHDPALDTDIQQFVNADREVTKWESVRQTTEARILARAVPARLDLCRSEGKLESSIRVNDVLLMTQKCQYSKIPADRLPELGEAFGDDSERYFIPRLNITLTPEASANEADLGKLIRALGPDEFRRVFKVERWAEVSETFHSDFTLRPEVQETALPFVDEEVIRSYKPTLRLA